VETSKKKMFEMFKLHCTVLTFVHCSFSNLLHTLVCLGIQHSHLVAKTLALLPISRQQPNVLGNTNSTWCSQAVTQLSTNRE